MPSQSDVSPESSSMLRELEQNFPLKSTNYELSRLAGHRQGKRHYCVRTPIAGTNKA